MSNDGVIDFEARTIITRALKAAIYSHPDGDNLRATALELLRAAPETVSLEGVEWRKSFETTGDAWAYKDDLRRLVAPVQPSARSWGEVGKLAQDKFDELAHKQWDWRSFYNGFLEGASSEREGLNILSEVHPSQEKERDGQTIGSNVPGLPVEDQVRLYRASGGSVDGERRLRERLEAPDQPSAVVSREWAFGVLCDQMLSFEQRINKVMDALRLPQPVAPVQGGGVELYTKLEYGVDRLIMEPDACTHEWFVAHGWEPLYKTHLTTTQSAPEERHD